MLGLIETLVLKYTVLNIYKLNYKFEVELMTAVSVYISNMNPIQELMAV